MRSGHTFPRFTVLGDLLERVLATATGGYLSRPNPRTSADELSAARRHVPWQFDATDYTFLLDDKPQIFSSDGAPIIDDLMLTYSTCTLHNLRVPVFKDRRIILDHVGGLEVNDEVLIVNNLYGGAVSPFYQVLCRVTEVGLSSIVIDRDLPEALYNYPTGIIVLRRSTEFSGFQVAGRGIAASLKEAVASYLVHTLHFDISVAIILRKDSQKIDIHTKTIFTRPCRLYNLSFVVRSRLPFQEIFLKNRARRDVRSSPLDHDIWLWKEGARAGTDQHGWLILNNPGISSAELITAYPGRRYKSYTNNDDPVLVINLQHFDAQHYRRHVENFTSTFSTFDDESLPAFEAGAAIEHNFSLHVGGKLPPPPRFSLTPFGFRATHVWTEHADKTTIESHRAAYYGHQHIECAQAATGGFSKFGHVVTKSVFFDNLGGDQNTVCISGRYQPAGKVLSYSRDAAFRSLLDDLTQLGHEICLHALTPSEVSSTGFVDKFAADAITEFCARYSSSTWIDHGMRDARLSIGWQGCSPFSAYRLSDHLASNGIRYIWTCSSTDFMPQSKVEINLLHNNNGEHNPTPLYWRHRSLPKGTVLWASHEAGIGAFASENVDRLIGDRGVSVHQHYYPYLVDEQYSFGFIQKNAKGEYTASPQFNQILATLAERRDAGELYLTTVGPIIQYWLDIELVEFELRRQEFVLYSSCDRVIKGFTIIVCAEALSSSDVALKSRPLGDGDIMAWFDLPPGREIHLRVVEA